MQSVRGQRSTRSYSAPSAPNGARSALDLVWPALEPTLDAPVPTTDTLLIVTGHAVVVKHRRVAFVHSASRRCKRVVSPGPSARVPPTSRFRDIGNLRTCLLSNGMP